MKEKVELEINRIISVLNNKQFADGSWRYCFESGPMTNAYMIILLRSLGIRDQNFIRKLAERIAANQEKNGAWKLYHDEEEGNLSATIEAYYALLYSGLKKKTEYNMQAAKQFILSHGGIKEASMLTKVMLALTGQYPWPKNFLIPVEILLLPLSFPIDIFDFVGYARVHIAPILITADRRFVLKSKQTPDLSDLYINRSSSKNMYSSYQIHKRLGEYSSVLNLTKQGIMNLPYLPQHIHSLALRSILYWSVSNRTEHYIATLARPFLWSSHCWHSGIRNIILLLPEPLRG